MTLARLKITVDVRLQTQSALYETSYEKLTAGKLNIGRQKLVQIYFDRIIKEMGQVSPG